MDSHKRRAIVVGAGIAGLTAALRLRQIGWEPVIVERAPARRSGGYLLSLFGIGYDAAERMGLLPALRERRFDPFELRYVKPDGRPSFSVPGSSVQAMLGARSLLLLRGDVEDVLYQAVRDAIEVRFGTTPESVRQDAGGVSVELSDGTTVEAELLVGADGLHSRIRHLVFGPEERFRRDLDHMVAAFTMDQLPSGIRAGAITTLATTGRTVTVAGLGPHHAAAFFMYGNADPSGELAKGAHLAVAAAFGDLGWTVPDLVARLERSEAVYFDGVSQVSLVNWSIGRVVLLGDAAWCVSLFAGYGASLAIAGADLLATELEAMPDDLPNVLPSWEARLRSEVESRQRQGRSNTAAHAPANRLQLALRNLTMRLLALPPARPLLRRHLKLRN